MNTIHSILKFKKKLQDIKDFQIS